MTTYNSKLNLPSLHELQELFGADPYSPTIDKDIWVELDTVKRVGTHTLKIIVPSAPLQGRYCIGSEYEKGYSFVNGQVFGVQIITICRNYVRCTLPGRSSVCKCGSYLYMILKSSECCNIQHSDLISERSATNDI